MDRRSWMRGLAQNKFHIVRSNKNPSRIMSYCGKILEGEIKMTNELEKNQICNYCVIVVSKHV